MKTVKHLVVGAGMSGLSFANAIRGAYAERGQNPDEADVCVIEASSEPGGYCKTIKKDGFVWDFSGHFFHFKHPEIEAWLRARMPGQEVRTVKKQTYIRYKGRDVDFPFQKNIHQLPQDEFVECLVDLYFRAEQAPEDGAANFKSMLFSRLGRGICEKFLIPYNEKLYACDLATLDADAMGRFFPHADVDDIIRNMRDADNSSYNATFTYPEGGAIEYVNAFLRELPEDIVQYDTRLERLDLQARIAHTSAGPIKYERLISSAPFNKLLNMSGLAHDASAFSFNKVQIFNLGFDKKGRDDVHWMYFPDRERVFYRVGWYDNIMGTDRMSLYVEIGAAAGDTIDVEATKARVLADLKAEGIITDHELVSMHEICLDPAYVHVTGAAQAEYDRLVPVLEANGVYTVGRYGGWTYCAIEDNIVETRALAATLGAV